MPGRVVDEPKKRVLTDATNTHNALKSPPSAKKRRLNGNASNVSFRSSQPGPNGFKSKLGSSQPKSQFETEVLEKMTQDISGLKKSNSEKDQQWDRPSLDDFDAHRDALRFQQIEVEEGTLHGGKTTVKMFGVSEVKTPRPFCDIVDLPRNRLDILSSFMSLISSIISMSPRLSASNGKMSRVTKHTWRLNWPNTSRPFIPCKWCCERIYTDFKAIKKALT